MPHEVDHLSGGKLQHTMDRRPSGARRLSYRVALWTVGLVLVLHATPSTRAVQPAEGWRLTLGANISGVTDQGRLTLGAVSEAAIELDDRDEPHPPALPSRYVDVYTEHNLGEPPEPALSSGARPPSARLRATRSVTVAMRPLYRTRVQ